MSAGPLAWHYTTGQASVRIVRSGYLEAAPAVWFSTRQDIEPSACRVVRRGDRLHLLTPGQTARMYGGWFRYGLPPSWLVPAEGVREQAGLPRELWRQRIATARAQDSNVRDWLASFQRVEVDRCVVQRLDGHPAQGTWRTLADPAAWFASKLDEEIAAEWRRLEAGG